MRNSSSASKAQPRELLLLHTSGNSASTRRQLWKIENPESVKKAVQNGLGIAFISAFAAETDLKAKTLVAVKIRNLEIRVS